MMSIHKSLTTKNRLRRQRNVLSRLERIEKLEDEERWSEDGDAVFALPKVKVARLKRPHAKKKEAEEEAALEGAEAVEGAGAEGEAGAKAEKPGARDSKKT
jgi:small basic protein (TIGR04137 family)